ncbi:hypothetical protein ACHAXS_014234 [Conticribra weissflogii]
MKAKDKNMVKIAPAEISPVAPVASADSTEDASEGAFLPPFSSNFRSKSDRLADDRSSSSNGARPDRNDEDPVENHGAEDQQGFGAPPPFPGASSNNFRGPRKRTLMAVSSSTPVEDDSSSEDESSAKPVSSQNIHRIKGGGAGIDFRTQGVHKQENQKDEDSQKNKIRDDAMLLASLSDLDKKKNEEANGRNANVKGDSNEGISTKVETSIKSPSMKSPEAYSTASTPRRSNVVNANKPGRVKSFALHPKPSPRADSSVKRPKIEMADRDETFSSSAPRKSPEVTPDHRPKAGHGSSPEREARNPEHSNASTPSREYRRKAMPPHPTHSTLGTPWNPRHPYPPPTHPYGTPPSYPYMAYPLQYGGHPPPPSPYPHSAPPGSAHPHPYHPRPTPHPEAHPHAPPPTREWGPPPPNHPSNPFSPPRMTHRTDSWPDSPKNHQDQFVPGPDWEGHRGGSTQPLYQHSSARGGGKSHVVPSEEIDGKRENKPIVGTVGRHRGEMNSSDNHSSYGPPPSSWYGHSHREGGQYPPRPETEPWPGHQDLSPSYPPHHDPRFGQPLPPPPHHAGRDLVYNPYYSTVPPPPGSIDPRDSMMNNEAFRVSTDDRSPRYIDNQHNSSMNSSTTHHLHPHQHPYHLEYPSLDTPPRADGVTYADDYYQEPSRHPTRSQGIPAPYPHCPSHGQPPPPPTHSRVPPPPPSGTTLDPYEPHPHNAPPPFPPLDYSTPPPPNEPQIYQNDHDPYEDVPAVVSHDHDVPCSSNTGGFSGNSNSKSRHQFRKGPRTVHSEPIILRKKFSWRNYPELEEYLIANRTEYLRHSALNYTAEQKHFNNRLTEGLLELAAKHNYIFDESCFNFVAVRDRIRCYYKSYVQSSKKRGVVVGFPKINSRNIGSNDGKKSDEGYAEGNA